MVDLGAGKNPVIILIDVSGSMGESGKLRIALQLCHSIQTSLRMRALGRDWSGVRYFAASESTLEPITVEDAEERISPPMGRLNLRSVCERLATITGVGCRAKILLLTDTQVGKYVFDRDLSPFVSELHLVLVGVENGERAPEVQPPVSCYSADDAIFALDKLLLGVLLENPS